MLLDRFVGTAVRRCAPVDMLVQDGHVDAVLRIRIWALLDETQSCQSRRMIYAGLV